MVNHLKILAVLLIISLSFLLGYAVAEYDSDYQEIDVINNLSARVSNLNAEWRLINNTLTYLVDKPINYYVPAYCDDLEYYYNKNKSEWCFKDIKEVIEYTRGMSMEPFSPEGYTLGIREFDEIHLDIGDVVYAEVTDVDRFGKEQKGYLVHRVFAVYGDYILLKGDANDGYEKIKKKDIKGIVCVQAFTRSPYAGQYGKITK